VLYAQSERQKPVSGGGNLSLFNATDDLFAAAADDDSPTFDLFAPATVSTFL